MFSISTDIIFSLAAVFIQVCRISNLFLFFFFSLTLILDSLSDWQKICKMFFYFPYCRNIWFIECCRLHFYHSPLYLSCIKPFLTYDECQQKVNVYCGMEERLNRRHCTKLPYIIYSHIIYEYLLIYSGNICALSIPYLSLLADLTSPIVNMYHPLLDCRGSEVKVIK